MLQWYSTHRHYSVRVVGFPEGSELPAVVDEDVLAGHEVRIALDGAEPIQVRQHLLHERLLLLLRAGDSTKLHCSQHLQRRHPVAAYLSHPDGLLVLLSDARDVLLEVRDVRRGVVDVDRDAVDAAPVTRLEEVVEPCLAGGRPAVRYRRRAELRLARERLHVLLPGSGGCRGRHVRLPCVVRLVESGSGHVSDERCGPTGVHVPQQVRRALLDRLLRVRVP